MSAIFNSTNQYAGYYQTFSGGDTAITIKRATGGEEVDAKGGDGFMVSQYQVQFARNVNIQRFLNMEQAVAIVGAGQGTMQLTGLVGTLDAFQRLLLGSDNTKEDVCNQLTIEIKDASSFNKCVDNNGTSQSGTIRCSGGIVQGIQLGGQIDQAGVLMQTGSLTIQFTQLDIVPAGSNDLGARGNGEYNGVTA